MQLLTNSLRQRLDGADLHTWLVSRIIIVAFHAWHFVRLDSIQIINCMTYHGGYTANMMVDLLSSAACGFDMLGMQVSPCQRSATQSHLAHREIPCLRFFAPALSARAAER